MGKTLRPELALVRHVAGVVRGTVPESPGLSGPERHPLSAASSHYARGMHLASELLVLAHLVGFAALLGGVLAQLRVVEPEVTGVMPAPSSSSSESWRCVVDAGWMTSDFASPTFASSEKSFSLSMNERAFGISNVTIAPAPLGK